MGRRIKVLVVDDHFIVRQGIRALFLDAPDVEIVGEAEDGAAALELTARLRPDVVLMDLAMPRMDGVEATRRILAERPKTRVLVLTASATIENEILDAVREGALGYLSKNASAEGCLRAVRRVFDGEPSLPPSLTRRLLDQLRSPPKTDRAPEHLTPREIEILGLVARGLDDGEIASSLCISRPTVRTHVSNVLAKLGLKNRVEATLWALRHGVASLAEEPAFEG